MKNNLKLEAAEKYLKSFVSYEDNLNYKYNEEFFDLKRFEAFLRDYGVRYDKLKCIHVAGSKGKGTTCHLIANYLSRSSERDVGGGVGLFTSPYISEITECFLIDGEKISVSDFVARVKKIRKFLDEWIDVASGRSITYFEILFTLVLEYFLDKKVRFAVIEVGLGGRLDATNVVLPLLTVLTRVEKEHTQILGRTYRKILNEKLGIVKDFNIKNHVPLIVAPQNNFVLREIKKRRSSVPTVYVDGGTKADANYATAFASLNNLSSRRLIKKVDSELLHDVYKKLKIIGRFDVRKVGDCTVVYDMAHTVESAKHLVSKLKRSFPGKKFVVLISMMKDKNVKEFLKEISKLNVSEMIFTSSHRMRGLKAAELKRIYKKKSFAIEDTLDAFKKALSDTKKWDRVLLVTGSHFLIHIVL